MNWQKIDINVNDFNLKNCSVLANDVNLKPDWVSEPAKFTEFHIQRDKKNLVLVIGESWAYGEALPDVATGIRKYDLNSQIRHCFGIKLGLLLECDYYQYAVPGNCNAYMYLELERILNHLSQFNYEKIFLISQITEPSREMPIIYKLKNHPITELYNFSSKISFDEWLIKYDEIFLDAIENAVTNYQNVSCIVWKNFCCFQNQKEYLNLKILKESWIVFSGKFLGVPLQMQKFQSVGWLDSMREKYKDLIVFNNKMLNEELDKIEASNNFINGNYLHHNHPNQIAHSLWALNLYNFIINEF